MESTHCCLLDNDAADDHESMRRQGPGLIDGDKREFLRERQLTVIVVVRTAATAASSIVVVIIVYKGQRKGQ